MNRIANQPAAEEPFPCLECGSDATQRVCETETFEHGGREQAFQVTAELPVIRCTRCGARFYDDESMTAKHEAACRHLGVMTPAEILALRERCGPSQKQFAELTGLGVATVGRWERGALIQNEANDRYLYLLTMPENVQRLRQRIGSPPPEPPRFRTEVPGRAPAGTFDLRPSRPRAPLPSRPRTPLPRPRAPLPSPN